ncbi:MAG: hypothetical protein JW982_09955 [Spirochaetes bacterium]|nr:hypothetical protein [Spirochaetota bacterium]
MKKIFITVFILSAITFCSTPQGVKYLKNPVSARSSIAVIIDCPNDIKNVVMAEFLKKGYNVKAVNASDMYTLSDVFDINDYSRLAYRNSEILSGQKLYENVYKMHIYNFESNKADMLNEMKNKWQVNYLILLELSDWKKISWARAIDLNSMELIWVENYPTKYKDTLDDVVTYFISSMSAK